MLIYKQKKLCIDPSLLVKPTIPKYWEETIKSMNEVYDQQRLAYGEMENQLDIIL